MSNINQAIDWLEQGNIDDALQLLHELSQSDDLLAHYDVKDVYYQYGFYDEGITLVQSMLKNAPKDGELLVSLAAMYIDIEKDHEAVDCLLQVDKEDPYYLSSLMMLADLYYVQGLFEVSESKLLEAKAYAPNEIVVDFALGELYYSLGEFHRAIAYYEKVNKLHAVLDHVSITERLAESYATIGKYEEALELYGQINSNNPNILFQHGYVAYQLKNYQTAIEKWEALLSIDPEYTSVYPELAKAYEEEAKYEDATRILQVGLTYDQFNKEIYLQLGKMYERQGLIAEAKTNAQEAIALDYDYKEAILFLIELYKREHDHEAIIHLLHEVSTMNSEDGDYDWEFARAYVEEEAYNKAKTYYDKAYQALHYDADFLKEYGYFLVEEGQMDQAIQILKKYIELAEEDEETIAFLQRVSFSNDDDHML